ncbi:hypothetical protein ACHAXR_011753 [Thalassiosira sp. AJA248-18]
MILRKSSLLPILLSAGTTTAYFAQVANAHVEFAATGTISESSSSGAETVDDRSSLQHSPSSLWATLEDALKDQSNNSNLGYAAPKIMALFEDWVDKFEKEYENLEEKSKRMLVWLENHVLIETHNAKKSSFTLGHNEFSDMTHVEFRERMNLGEFAPELINNHKKFNFMEHGEEEKKEMNNSSNLRGPAEVAVERKLQAATDEIDWHDKGLMGPIRNQGICGACWAFSAIGSIESAMAIDKYNKMTPNEQAELAEKAKVDGEEEKNGLTNDLGLVVPLSEQDLIDCDTLYEKGCQGGLMTTTFTDADRRQSTSASSSVVMVSVELALPMHWHNGQSGGQTVVEFVLSRSVIMSVGNSWSCLALLS